MKEIIETRNVRAVKNAVRDTINKNGMIAVIADVGAGKSTMYSVLKNYWDSYPHKFSVVEMKSFRSRHSRISSIMELLIGACEPGATVPQVIEKRFFMLRDVLRSTKKHVILVADEAQDLNLQTYRDLKKIHEIDGDGRSHLFSIVLFGKTHQQWGRIFATPELGYRLQYLKLEALTSDETILIAEKAFLLKFQNERVKERFSASMIHRTPLDIEFAANSIRHFFGVSEDEVVTVSDEIIAQLSRLTLRYQVNLAGIKQKAIAERASNELNRNVSVQRVSELMNDNLKDKKLGDQLEAIVKKMLNENYSRPREASGSTL